MGEFYEKILAHRPTYPFYNLRYYISEAQRGNQPISFVVVRPDRTIIAPTRVHEEPGPVYGSRHGFNVTLRNNLGFDSWIKASLHTEIFLTGTSTRRDIAPIGGGEGSVFMTDGEERTLSFDMILNPVGYRRHWTDRREYYSQRVPAFVPLIMNLSTYYQYTCEPGQEPSFWYGCDPYEEPHRWMNIPRGCHFCFLIFGAIHGDGSKVEEFINRYGTPTLDDVAKILEEMKDRLPPMPDIRYDRSQYPSLMPAGEPFSIEHHLKNPGSPGTGLWDMTINGEKSSYPLEVDGLPMFTERLEMPYFDLSRSYSLDLYSDVEPKVEIVDTSLGRPIDLRLLTDTRAFTIPITAGFPLAILGDITAPITLRPGDKIEIGFPVRNDGYRGDIGLRLSADDFSRETMERVDSGATMMATFEGEMPVTEVYRISATPIHIGKNRETISGAEKTIEITPINCLFHKENIVELFGGYPELNTFTGFIAGKNVRVSGLSTTPGTGGPLGGLIPYGGYILSGSLGPEDRATIDFDELYFLRVETARGIATARLDNLIERDSKLYEFSVVPTLAMMAHPVSVITTAMRKVAPRLR